MYSANVYLLFIYDYYYYHYYYFYNIYFHMLLLLLLLLPIIIIINLFITRLTYSPVYDQFVQYPIRPIPCPSTPCLVHITHQANDVSILDIMHIILNLYSIRPCEQN